MIVLLVVRWIVLVTSQIHDSAGSIKRERYTIDGARSSSRLPWRVEHHQQGLVLRRQVLELLVSELEHVAPVAQCQREGAEQGERHASSHGQSKRGEVHSFMNHNKDKTLPAVSRAGGT